MFRYFLGHNQGEKHVKELYKTLEYIVISE